MIKERMLTVLVPIKDSDTTQVSALPAIDSNNINVIYKYNGSYYRLWTNPASGQLEYHTVVDREFPYLGRPMEIFDFTYTAERMGHAPVISVQKIKWFADKDVDGNDVTLDRLWTQECHVIFNGENLYLKQIPTSSKTNEDARYTYDLDFVSERVVLETVYLYDIALPYITEVITSESATFSFYGNVEEFAKRINASLIHSGLSSLVRKYVDYPTASGVTVPYLSFEQWNRCGVDLNSLVGVVFSDAVEALRFYSSIYYGLGCDYYRYLRDYIYENEDGDYTVVGYKVVIGKDKYGNMTTSEDKLLTFDKNYIIEALQQIWEVFELQYYVQREQNEQGAFTGNTLIVIADCEHDFADMNAAGTDYVRDDDGVPTTYHPFDYGVDAQLLSKEKINTTDKIITRITGVGSEENIPWYYPNPMADGWIRPVYKRSGTVQNIDVEYPTSEGDTVAANTLYEKYLKNRLGDTINWGKTIIAREGNTGYNLFGYVGLLFDGYVFCYDFVIEGNDKIMHFDLSCLFDDYSSLVLSVTKDGDAYSGLNLSLGTESIVAIPAGDYRLTITCMVNNRLYQTRGAKYHYSVNWPEHGLTLHNFHYYSELPNLLLMRTGENRGEWFFYSDPADPYGSKVAMEVPQANSEILVWFESGGEMIIIRHTYDDECELHVGGIVYMYPEDFIQKYMTGTFSVIQTDGWYRNNRKLQLADYGITNESALSANATILDTIEFQRVKWITPQQRLMPELFIKTDGERRFYDAIFYPKRYTSGDPIDTDAGEQLHTSGVGPLQIQEIINNLYKKNESQHSHYRFENLYMPNLPHEHIEEFDDIKPSIKEHQLVMTIGGVTASHRIDIVEEFEYDQFDNDEIWESNDDGNIAGEYKHPYFFAKLRPLGFNLFDMALQEDMVLSMTTGHCGACNFKIGVDENTKKNPVQLWEYDVYGGPTYANRGNRIYAAGTLRRHVDTSNLHYNKDNTEDGYVFVDMPNSTPGFLVPVQAVSADRTAMFERRTFTADQVLSGEVGSLRREPKNHFVGDVMTSGKFLDSQQDTTRNFVWVALYKDTDTYGTVMPAAQPDYGNSAYSKFIDPKGHIYHNRKTGVDEEYSDTEADNFVLINIRLPQAYLREAEHFLSRNIIAYMYDNNYQKFNIGGKFSRIFLAQNLNIENKLNENSVLYINYNNKTYRQYVKTYTYKMSHETVLPEISVSMNEELNITKTRVERERRVEINRSRRTREAIEISSNDMENSMRQVCISRNDDTVIRSNFVSADNGSSLLSINSGLRRTELLISDTRGRMTHDFTYRSTFDNAMNKLNTFNSGVANELQQIRKTVEFRLMPYATGGKEDAKCQGRYVWTVDNQDYYFWLDETGKMQVVPNECTTSNGMDDVTWSNE